MGVESMDAVKPKPLYPLNNIISESNHWMEQPALSLPREEVDDVLKDAIEAITYYRGVKKDLRTRRSQYVSRHGSEFVDEIQGVVNRFVALLNEKKSALNYAKLEPPSKV